MAWAQSPWRGFTFVADTSARVTWSFARGELVLIVPSGVRYAPMPPGWSRRGRRIAAARPEAAARPAAHARAATPEQPG